MSAAQRRFLCLAQMGPRIGLDVRVCEMLWLFLVFGLLPGRCKLFCVAAHPLFGEYNGAYFIGLRLLLQKFAAQQRKILNPDSISRNQSQIHCDRAVDPTGIDSALKGVGPNTSGLGKSR